MANNTNTTAVRFNSGQAVVNSIVVEVAKESGR